MREAAVRIQDRRSEPGPAAELARPQAIDSKAERPAARAPQEAEPVAAAAPSLAPEAPAKGRRRWLRPFLFLLLPVALLGGGYSYVTGGQVMSTENAYVHADTVAVSTDVSGIVKTVNVKDNQKVAAGDVLFTLDDLPFQLALTRANAQIGIIGDQLKALQASYRDMQAQIKQAQVDVDVLRARVRSASSSWWRATPPRRSRWSRRNATSMPRARRSRRSPSSSPASPPTWPAIRTGRSRSIRNT